MTPNPVTPGELLFYPHEFLRVTCEPVSNFDEGLKQVVNAMIATMRALDGAGLAAPQIGVDLRIIVLGWQDPPIVAINPTFVKREGSRRGTEGCLSMPEVFGQVERAQSVKVEAYDTRGRPFLFSAIDFNASVVQHEIDHLNGVLFIDHLATRQQRRAAEREWFKVHEWAIANTRARLALRCSDSGDEVNHEYPPPPAFTTASNYWLPNPARTPS